MAENDKKVSAMLAAQTLTQGDLFYLAAENQTSASGYESFKITAGDIAQQILGAFSFPLVLNTTAKNVFGAINELKATADDGAVVLLGTAAPAANAGVDGNIYIRYTTSGNATTITNMYVKISGAWSEVSTGGGGGSSTLAGLTDVDLTTPTDGQALLYDAQNSKWINGTAGGGSGSSKIYVGTCSTAAGTAQKEITIPSAQGFTLEVGAIICVKFTNTNTASNVTFSVNGGTAYPIWYSTAAYTGSTGNVTGNAGAYMFYVFDGSYWCWESMGKYNSYNAMTQAQAEAGTSTSNFVLSPAVLKSGILAHAMPIWRPTERLIGYDSVGAAVYEQEFTFAASDFHGGEQSNSRISGAFYLPHINFLYVEIVKGTVFTQVMTTALTVLSLPVPFASANGQYARCLIQKTESNDGYPFIFFDMTYSAANYNGNLSNISFVFTLRYTKASM